MHLGLYHEPVHTDGRAFDTYGPYARYVLELARHFDHVTVFAPTTTRDTFFSGCRIDGPNVTVAPLPWFTTHAGAYLRAASISGIFARHCADLDVIECRGTAPLAYLLWLKTRKRGVPFLYHFASDPFEMIRTSPRYRGPYGWFARAAYGAEFTIQKHIMRRNFSFADGDRIARRLSRYTDRVAPLFASSLIESDFHLRIDCCQGRPIRVLYVGYLRQNKGLDDLMEAVAILRRQGKEVDLEFVGDGEMRQTLQFRSRLMGIDHHVHFRGYMVMGPRLNEAYNQADIFVLPSLSEGSPRCVLEAMGHSLPVVATAVGNIAEMLDGGRRGTIIAPKDPKAIADAVTAIIDGPDLRRRYIAEGYKFARAHDLAAFVAPVVAKARELAACKGGKQ